MINSICITLLLLISQCLPAQELIDIAGVWEGHSTFARTNYQVTFAIAQAGTQLQGTSTTVSLDRKDSIVVAFTGVLEGSTLEIFANEVLYKKGNGCMANNVLSYSIADDQPRLTGKWKGDMRLTSCPPLVGGDISLYREPEEAPPEVIRTDARVEGFANDDLVGEAMVTELKRRKYHALLVGVESYPHPAIAQLSHPVNDATAFGQVLSTHYGFDTKNVISLKNPTRSEIIKSLDQLRQQVSEQDQVLIFYAGHGIWEEDLNQGYWLPSDASMDSKSQWISNGTIRDHIRGIPSKHTLLITDACFSGGILRERAVFENSRAMLELYKMPSRKAMTSGTLKTVPDKSVFMHYLLKSLRDNDQPLLSADQLFRRFKLAVINNSPNAQVPQYGPIWQAGDEGGDFIFLKETREEP